MAARDAAAAARSPCARPRLGPMVGRSGAIPKYEQVIAQTMRDHAEDRLSRVGSGSPAARSREDRVVTRILAKNFRRDEIAKRVKLEATSQRGTRDTRESGVVPRSRPKCGGRRWTPDRAAIPRKAHPARRMWPADRPPRSTPLVSLQGGNTGVGATPGPRPPSRARALRGDEAVDHPRHGSAETRKSLHRRSTGAKKGTIAREVVRETARSSAQAFQPVELFNPTGVLAEESLSGDALFARFAPNEAAGSSRGRSHAGSLPGALPSAEIAHRQFKMQTLASSD